MAFPLTSPLARRTDPQSSHSAAEEVTRSGKREGQVLAVLALVRKYPGSTSLELAKHSVGLDRYVTARRLPELEKQGLVRKGDERPCTINGRSMVTWWPTDYRKPEQLRLGV